MASFGAVRCAVPHRTAAGDEKGQPRLLANPLPESGYRPIGATNPVHCTGTQHRLQPRATKGVDAATRGPAGVTKHA